MRSSGYTGTHWHCKGGELHGGVHPRQRCLSESAAWRYRCIPPFREGKQYTAIDGLTPQLLRLFIQRIEIGERTKKHSRSAGQSVRIVYQHIGALDTPMREGDPAPRMTKAITEKEEIIRLLA